MSETADANRRSKVWWSLLTVVIVGGILVPGNWLPAVVFLVVLLSLVKSLRKAGRVLPKRVASHFTFRRTADGWMSRRAYQAVMTGLAVVMGVLLPLGMYFAGLQAGDAKLQRLALWMLPLMGSLLLGLNELVIDANLREPAVLSRWVWALLGMILLTINAWLLTMFLPW